MKDKRNMKKDHKNPQQQTNQTSDDIKEFSANDVRNMYKSVDETVGFGIDFVIRMHRITMKTMADMDESEKNESTPHKIKNKEKDNE
jgi:hypothetical protein